MYLDEESSRAMLAELAALRDRVSGVLGCVLAGVDGLLILNDAGPGIEPHDVAAMAAATVGLSRQFGRALHQGVFQECTVRSTQGHFAVYSVGEWAVLAVRATEGLNIARLHLEARAMASRLADALPTNQWYAQTWPPS
ncbi:roadblock/LC7 domain-containing protein [Micromonospora sonneratiae]